MEIIRDNSFIDSFIGKSFFLDLKNVSSTGVPIIETTEGNADATFNLFKNGANSGGYLTTRYIWKGYDTTIAFPSICTIVVDSVAVSLGLQNTIEDLVIALNNMGYGYFTIDTSSIVPTVKSIKGWTYQFTLGVITSGQTKAPTTKNNVINGSDVQVVNSSLAYNALFLDFLSNPAKVEALTIQPTRKNILQAIQPMIAQKSDASGNIVGEQSIPFINQYNSNKIVPIGDVNIFFDGNHFMTYTLSPKVPATKANNEYVRMNFKIKQSISMPININTNNE